MDYRHNPRMHWQHGGHWRRGHPGFFLPPFAMVFGFFLLFMVFKTGLWIPLLVLGLIFWATRSCRYGRGGWEKAKRGGGDWWTDDTSDKPKRDEYI